MIVKLDLDPRVVWRLSEIAERRGVTESVVVAELVGTRPRTARQDAGEVTRKKVIELHAAGLSDREIALSVGRVVEHVSRVRKAAGLPRNGEKK